MFSLSLQQERWIHGCSRAGLDSGRAWFKPAHALAEDEGDPRAHRRGPPDRGCCFSLPQGGAVRIQRLLSGTVSIIVSSSHMGVNDVTMVCYTWFRPCLHVVSGKPKELRSCSGMCLQNVCNCCWTTCIKESSRLTTTTFRQWLLLPSCSMWMELLGEKSSLNCVGFCFVSEDLYVYLNCDKLNSSSTVNLCLV